MDNKPDIDKYEDKNSFEKFPTYTTKDHIIHIIVTLLITVFIIALLPFMIHGLLFLVKGIIMLIVDFYNEWLNTWQNIFS